jgi:hypothetical protein
MFFDKENQLSSAQAFTGAATVATNSYKMQVVGNDISIGRRMALWCRVTTAAGAGSTHTMEVVQTTDGATAGLLVVNAVTILAATLTAGYVFEIPIPSNSLSLQYIGFRNTATGGTTTVSLDVYLVPQDEIAKYKSFPKVIDAEV